MLQFKKYFQLLLLLIVDLAHLTSSTNISLVILHTADVHSRFLQTNKYYGGHCSEKDAERQECYGGFARLHYKVKEIRARNKNVVYLSGGDYFHGSVWYTLYRWKVVSHFVNLLNHTAMALGNHEFDDGAKGLVPFLEAATFPILSCNIDDPKEVSIQGKYRKSVVVEVEGHPGRKIGIIGYTTPDTKITSDPGNVTFLDMIPSINKEAQRLYNQGVRILIALGHGGFDSDQQIANKVPLIDVVVGGHSNTFLYSGNPPDIETPKGDYPTVIRQPSGRLVPIVHAYTFGKYLGYLNLTLNEDDEVVAWNGNPILLDGSIPEDPGMLKELEIWKSKISHLMQVPVGETRVSLDGRSCRYRECNMGNIITDAMVNAVSGENVTVGIINGGSLQGSIHQFPNPSGGVGGPISLEDIMTLLPYWNSELDLIEIQGVHLKQAFELSIANYNTNAYYLYGKFFQVSGIRVVYDISQPNGSKVKELSVLCQNNQSYVPLDPNAVYKVAVPHFLVIGGDGFTIIQEQKLSLDLSGIRISDLVTDYIKSHEPVVQDVEGRSKFETGTVND